ncbi:MAG: hypothetical protein ACLUVC_14525 [Longibaculum sp.]
MYFFKLMLLIYHFCKSMNHNKVMKANPIEEKEVKPGQEIVLWEVLGYKEENADVKEVSDFKDADCDYGLVITITFYDKDIDEK